jgi:stage II sporulation protein D
VLPRELGPELYPRLEALKAQAVAARTYTLRHLGEFAGEGFDICA